MTPMVITDHMVNRPSTDTEATSQGGGSMIRRLRNVCATDHSDLLSRQFRWACRCAFQGSPSPLFMHVFVVVGLRSKKQMNRIDACCDIACVKDIHAIRNRSEREMPRETMSQPFSVIETHFSVAATILRRCPKPARICFHHARPKGRFGIPATFPTNQRHVPFNEIGHERILMQREAA